MPNSPRILRPESKTLSKKRQSEHFSGPIDDIFDPPLKQDLQFNRKYIGEFIGKIEKVNRIAIGTRKKRDLVENQFFMHIFSIFFNFYAIDKV